ncbi:MAG TPA: hypothetical protein VF006_18280 [Longimicrobium sp.]
MSDRFVEAVRAGVQEGGDLKGPNQNGFSRDAWIAAYEGIVSPTVADTRLFNAGLWLDEALRNTRELASQARERLNGIPRRELMRLHVGFVNFVVSVDTAAVGGGQTRLRFGGAEGGDPYEVEATPAALDLSGAVSTFVDAARYAFAEGKRARTNGDRDWVGDDSVVGALLATSRIGRMYSAFETVWNECLWNGWRVGESQDGMDVIVPVDLEIAVARAVGDARRDSLYYQVPFLARQIWRRLPEEERRRWWAIARVGGAERTEDGTITPVLGRRAFDPDNPPPEFLFWQILVDGEMGFLPDEPLPRLAGLTVRQLFDVWAVLASFGEVLQSIAPTPQENPPPEDLLEHAPLIRRDRLEEFVAQAVNLPAAHAQTALSVFVSPGTARSDPWLEPLVAVGDGLLAPVVVALRWPNLTRSIEHWLQEGGLDMARRGILFEEAVRRDLARKNRIEGASVHPTAVQYANEIDLVVRLGSTFLIGEVKCTVFPAEAHDYHTYWEILREAAGQAQYRANVLAADPKPFLDQIGVGDLDPAGCRFLPLVVTNVHAGTGHEFDKVPVVDPLVLHAFFAEGRILSWVVEGHDGVQHAREVLLYHSSREAEAAIEAYLAAPPQILRLREWIVVETPPMVPPDIWPHAPRFAYIRVQIPETVEVPAEA